jgi:hypothetical protein
MQNSEFNAGGSVASGRQLPQNPGFGAATGAAAMPASDPENELRLH